MIKLLYILWDGKLGGAASNIVDFAKNTKPARYQITVCLISNSGRIINSLKASNIQIIEFKAKSGLDIFAFFRFLKFLWKHKFDIIHNNNRTYFAHLAIILAGHRTPRLYHEHGDLHTRGEEKKSAFAYRLFSKFYNKFITVSNETMNYIYRAGVPAKKVINVGNPIDLKYFNNTTSIAEAKRKLGFSPQTLIVGTAARFVKEKDISLFLKTANEINKTLPNVHFVLAGGGAEELHLRKLTKELGLNDKVHFVGIHIDMPCVYKAFDVFLFTSYTESFGRSILESLYSGIPIVAVLPDSGGGRELIKQAEGISYIINRNCKFLADLAVELLQNPEERRLNGDLGKKWVANKTDYHIDAWIQRLEKTYFQLINTK